MNRRFYFLFNVTLLVCLVASFIRVKAQQPTWSATGALGAPRAMHTATPLANGKVLIVGGINVSNPRSPAVGGAELYDPATGRWSATGDPVARRFFHTAVRLANGKVLIVGGFGDAQSILFSAEIYDPDTGAWRAAGNLNVMRQSSGAILLADGRVLVAGGAAAGGVTNTAEVYDPASNKWSPTGAMNDARALHSITLLPNGKALVAGGVGTNLLRTAEIYDPATGGWTLTGELAAPRAGHPAILLANGKVLVAGGGDGNGAASARAELYDAATGQWSATGNLTTPRFLHTLNLLPNGKVLAAAGRDSNLTTLKSAELFDPAAGVWTLTAAPGEARHSHTATLLPNGKVLTAGGQVADGPTLSGAELFDSGAPNFLSVSSASFAVGQLAPEAIIAGFGSTLAANTQTAAQLPLPTQLAGVGVGVRDRTGAERAAPLFFVSPNQINYLIPSGTANGPATIKVSSGAVGVVEIANVAPGLFSANSDGQGVVAAVVLRINAAGAQSYEPVAQFDAGQNRMVAAPIDVGNRTEQVFLILYGTGFRHRSDLAKVTARIGNATLGVMFAGAQGGFAGLDQCNVRLPTLLAGAGDVNVTLTVDGVTSNVVTARIK
jgi:uncharacterized protein (TIGR03437 family)